MQIEGATWQGFTAENHLALILVSLCQVTEAIRIGAEAMKQNKITVEEVEHCLEELEESIDAQKQVEKALGILSVSPPLYAWT